MKNFTNLNRKNLFTLCKTITAILCETQRPKYLPEWLYNYWHSGANSVFQLRDTIKHIEKHLDSSEDLSQEWDLLIKTLDKERYLARVHLDDNKLFELIQNAMIVLLFFSEEDINHYDQFLLAKDSSEKFIGYLNTKREVAEYEKYLKQQQAFFGRLIKNLSTEEINLAAKTQMVNGKLLDLFHLEEFLKHGFHYIIKELKVLSINKIEIGFLNQERIESYINKISFLMHPANELALLPSELIKSARYILEDILNAVGVKSEKAHYPEYKLIINSCYWIDEMFKSAVGEEEFEDNIIN